MRRLLLWSLCCFLIGFAPVHAQRINMEDLDHVVRLSLQTFAEETTEVPGHGGQVEGLSLLGRKARHRAGDTIGVEQRAFVDTLWKGYRSDRDSVYQNTGLHWLRINISPNPSLKDLPLVAYVSARHPFTLYLNGEELLSVDPRPANDSLAPSFVERDLPPYSVPIRFLCDGTNEVLVLRVEGPPGLSLDQMEPVLTLHKADVNYRAQRSMMHHGVFVGVNVIIALLALVLGWSERRRTAWVLLFLLSMLAVVDIVSSLGGDTNMLGLPAGIKSALRLINMIIMPWSPYLLIRLLGEMGVEMSRKRKRLYLSGAIIVTLLIVLVIVGERMGLVDATDGLSLMNDQPWLIIPGLLFLALFGAIIVWFSIDVIRLGIKLLRTPGYARWIGGGAVASSLVTVLLNVAGAFSGSGVSTWLTLFADYCSFVAVPVSVTVFLAIRAAHHNRLVERQRDDLDREVQDRTAELRKEKERSDELLLNILPAEVAEELKSQGSAAARHFDEASVLFTDFKGFTSMAAQVDAAELLHELNACFHAFDDIIDAHGVEKIKTIGDAYMCAGGLPDPRSASPLAVVLAALEMQEFMQQRRAERMAQGKPAFEMRLGIHTGPVVAGIVGVKKFQYDIWGDTVNTASRMESTGEVGEVNISATTYERVRNEPGLVFHERGHIDVKGKGSMEMYFVRRSVEVAQVNVGSRSLSEDQDSQDEL